MKAPGGSTKIETGGVKVDPTVEDLETSLAPGTVRSQDGAVAAFTSLATWLIAAPAVREEPVQAVEEVGDRMLNPADTQLLVGMVRSERDDVEPERGGYRVVGYAGKSEQPDQVIVEIVAPLTTKGGTRWTNIGGVVRWAEGEWHLVSIAPRELASQPSSGADSASTMSAEDRAIVFEGLGWHLFASREE